MKYEMSTYNVVANDKTSIMRTIRVPVEEVEVIQKDDWYKTASIKSKRKFFRVIDRTIDYNKEIFSSTYSEVKEHRGFVLFEITTREKWRVERENEVKKTLMDNGIHVGKWDTVDLEKSGWFRLERLIDPTKKNMDFLEQIFDIKDWKIVFDGFMETMYLYLLLNEEASYL